MPELYECHNCGSTTSYGSYNIITQEFTCLACYNPEFSNTTTIAENRCANCGVELTDNDDALCADCEAKHYICDNCGVESFDGNSLVVNTNEVWCPDCFNSSHCCSWCITRVNDSDLVCDNHDDQRLCENCQDDAFICEGCGHWCRNDDYYDGNGYCADCNDDNDDDNDDNIHVHDYKPNPNFLPTYDNTELYLGVELETDKYNSYTTAAAKLVELNQSQYYLKEDGSLSYGFEVVTHPATLEYHQKTMPWDKISEIVTSHDGRSHETITCGLHVHFNKDYYGYNSDEIDYNTMKLLYLFECHWGHLVKFSRRRELELAAWAKRYHADCDTLTRRKEGITLIKQYKRYGRFYAVNLENDCTIEIRIFKGTLNVVTLLACIELTAFLVNFAKKHRPNQLRKLSWFELTNKIKPKKYPNLAAYINKIRRNEDVSTDCEA